jgi:hypothetical protein
MTIFNVHITQADTYFHNIYRILKNTPNDVNIEIKIPKYLNH